MSAITAPRLRRVLEAGAPGETYNIGGDNQKTNIEVVRTICALLDAKRPKADGTSYASQITFVTDRPGHDRRYAIDARKIERELGWRPAETFATWPRKDRRLVPGQLRPGSPMSPAAPTATGWRRHYG